MDKRIKGRRNRQMNKTSYFPSVEPDLRLSKKDQTQNSRHVNRSEALNDTSKHKIRFQGRPNQTVWGSLHKHLNTGNKTKRMDKSSSSIKGKHVFTSEATYSIEITKNLFLDAEKHAKILAKIEKYKEDKILEELKMIEFEKLKTERMLKIKREKERRRKLYIGERLTF